MSQIRVGTFFRGEKQERKREKHQLTSREGDLARDAKKVPWLFETVLEQLDLQQQTISQPFITTIFQPSFSGDFPLWVIYLLAIYKLIRGLGPTNQSHCGLHQHTYLSYKLFVKKMQQLSKRLIFTNSQIKKLVQSTSQTTSSCKNIQYPFGFSICEPAFSFLAFSSLFFFFSPHLLTFQRQNSLFMNSACTIHAFKNIKNESHGTIHTFKNYFATVFSVFSFSNNKFNLNRPIMSKRKGRQLDLKQ